MSKKDQIFQEKTAGERPFAFNKSVASVFVDMAERSIPLYREVQRVSAELALNFYQPGTVIYDLGCASGETIKAIINAFQQEERDDYSIVGIDSSKGMIEKAASAVASSSQKCRLLCKKLDHCSLKKTSVVLLNYTLHFLKPKEKVALIKKVFDALTPGGILLLSDKIDQQSRDISRFYEAAYYRFKQEKGYSLMEIARKRAALNSVMSPLCWEKQVDLLKKSGFKVVEPLLWWFKFATFLAVKEDCPDKTSLSESCNRPNQ